MPNEPRVTNRAGFLAATRRAGVIIAPSVVVATALAALAGQTLGRLFGVTKRRLLRRAERNNHCQQGQGHACEQTLKTSQINGDILWDH